MKGLAGALLPPHRVPRKRVDAITEGEVAPILQRIRPLSMGIEISPEARDMIVAAGNAAMLEVGFSASFNMLNPNVISYLNRIGGDKIKSITDTTTKAIRKQLVEGIEAGEGARRISRRVRETMSLPSTAIRATTIARTEVHNAASFARLEAYRQTGLVPQKRWHATIDGRVRDQHRKLHGKTIGIDESFKIGGAKALTPGGFGVARHDINCRCTILPITARLDGLELLRIDEEESAKAFWRLVNKEIEPMRRAVMRGFRRWERDVLRAIQEFDAG